MQKKGVKVSRECMHDTKGKLLYNLDPTLCVCFSGHESFHRQVEKENC